MINIEEIRNNPESTNWYYISTYQKLSEDFIREFQDKVSWNCISTYQKLSEDFIREFQHKVSWNNISRYQKLSEDFIREFNLNIPEDSWMYKDIDFKRKYIQENTEYEIIDDKIIAYKSVRENGYSVFNFQYLYEIGNEYESHADYNPKNENSFGLSAWTKEGALGYYNKGKIFKVEININDIACIVHNGKKIRTSKLKIIGE
jgi:hypothetical protein